MKKNFEFWLDLNVDGFHIDAAYHLMEDPSFQMEPLSGLTDDENDPKYTIKTFSQDNFGTFELLKEWREIIHEKNSDAILMVETSENVESFVKYLEVSDIPMNRFFINQFNKNLSAQELKSRVEKLLSVYEKVENVEIWKIGAIGIPVS